MRREFIAGLTGAVAVPLVAEAQQAGMPIIDYLGSESPERYGIRLEAFKQGLSAMGYDEGRNVMVEYRWAGGQADRLPALAADLVGRRVDVISVPGSVVAALAAKAATETIPIVFEMGLDPVAVNLVSSLSKPEANVTGITSLNVEVGPKRLQLLH